MRRLTLKKNQVNWISQESFYCSPYQRGALAFRGDNGENQLNSCAEKCPMGRDRYANEVKPDPISLETNRGPTQVGIAPLHGRDRRIDIICHLSELSQLSFSSH